MANRFIDKLQGFGELAAADIKALEAATTRSQSVGPRKDLIREGDPTGPVFVMLEG